MYNNEGVYEKACRDNCGKIIYFSQQRNCFCDKGTTNRHDCPNYRPKRNDTQDEILDNLFDLRERITSTQKSVAAVQSTVNDLQSYVKAVVRTGVST